MLDKAEVAFFSALAKRLGADEVDIVKVSVIDDVAVAEHLSESAQKTAFAEFMLVEALVALEVIAVFGVVVEPGISPTLPGAHLEAQRNDFFHDRKKARQPRHFPELFRGKRRPHVG